MQEAQSKRTGLYESSMTCKKGRCGREMEYNSVSFLSNRSSSFVREKQDLKFMI